MDRNGILIRLSESDKTQFGKEDLSSQSRPQKVFSAIWALEGEVNNGGFSQYFLNSLDESPSFVAEALETIAPENSRHLQASDFNRFPRRTAPGIRSNSIGCR